MSNVVLKLCRETKEYTPARIAKALGVTVKLYTEMEAGDQLMNQDHAEKLGKLYKMKADYFYTAALQLDSLLVRKEVIRILKWKNEQLESQLNRRSKAAPAKGPAKRKPKTNTPPNPLP